MVFLQKALKSGFWLIRWRAVSRSLLLERRHDVTVMLWLVVKVIHQFVCFVPVEHRVEELVAEGLIYVVPAEQAQGAGMNMSGVAIPGLANGYVAPGYTANSATPWSAAVPASPSVDALSNSYASLPFETESQWGNGGNGATFIPGRGWITTPQPMLPLHSSGPLASSGDVYAQVGSSRY